MNRWHAIVRPPTEALSRCQLTHLSRQAIDPARASLQHAEYCAALASWGVLVHALEPAPEQPDAVFVEDPAIVLDELAVLTRPTASRSREVEGIASALAPFRELARLPAGVELEGGDCLRVGRRLYVGISTRSTRAGFAALAGLLEPLGYELREVKVRGALHLKSACTWLEGNRVIVNPDAVDMDALSGLDLLAVEPGEELAACVVSIDGRLIAQAAAPRTNAKLRAEGHAVIELDFSELAKAEAGPTCCSLLFRDTPASRAEPPGR